MKAKDRLIFALDVPDRGKARDLINQLQFDIGMIKIGLELFIAAGPDFVHQLAGEIPIMLDLKLHDIPATVGRAAKAASLLGVDYLTVHIGDDAAGIAAAVDAAPDIKILGITVLTSIGVGALGGATKNLLVDRRARDAARAGAAGLVCSGQEVKQLRSTYPDVELFVPGIRPTEVQNDDQKRVTTPEEAIAKGASRIVVGRPIRDAADPVVAARAIVAEIEAVRNGR